MGCTGLDGVKISWIDLNNMFKFSPDEALPENEFFLEYECLLYQS